MVKLFSFRKNKEVRTNQTLLTPTESTTYGNYVAQIIKRQYYNFYNINHRKAVCELDPIAEKHTKIWRDIATAKTFKFYTSHEVDATETMQDIRKKWIELNCTELFKKCIVPFVRDGFVLIRKPKIVNERLDYDVYGEFECPPQQWTRVNNKIVSYKVEYTPRPRAFGSSKSLLGNQIDIGGNDDFSIIREIYSAKEIIHIERGQPNHGYGDSLIEGAWDSIIKLAGDSHYDMLSKRLVPQLEVTEDEYSSDESKVKGMLKMVANSDQATARVWYKKKDSKGEITEFPRFGYVSGTTGVDHANSTGKHEGISTGDYGNVSKEWMRLCTITGHTIHYYAGNRAGAVVGAEADTDDDINQEIIDFELLTPIIRKILEIMESFGLITLPKESFVIKYWKDWENIEAKAKAKEDMLQQNPNQPNEQSQLGQKETQQLPDRRNEAVMFDLLHHMKSNMSYPMTAVGSSWIARIGYYDVTEKLYMELLSGAVYSKPAPMGEWSYLDWSETGSKGGYFWDYLSQRDPPWQLDTIPPELVEMGLGTPEEMSEFKTGLIGESREPYEWEDLEKLKKKQQAYDLVKIPVLDYPLINELDTETKIKRLGQKNDWSMGTSTATRIKKILSSVKENAHKHQLRYNTMSAEAFGNSIKENHPLLYDIGNGIIVEEYICPDSWKANIGKHVPLGIYHNVEENSPILPEWQIIGNAEIFGWDDDDGYDYVKYNYDYELIEEVFKKLGEYNWLTPALKENGTNDISTAYYCDVEIRWNDTLQKFIRVQTNIELMSISFVPRGNCPGEVCSLTVVKHNISEMQKYIKKCIHEGIDKDQCLAKAYAKFKNGR